MDRRFFLQSLVALGAGWQLTPAIAKAESATIDEAWQQQLANPTEFAVDNCGTIWMPDVDEIQYRHQAFHVRVKQGMPAAELASEIAACPALENHLCTVCELELERLGDQGDSASKARFRSLERRVNRQRNGEEWRAWLDQRAADGRVDEVVSEITDWLDGGLDEPDFPYLCRTSGPQGEAMDFFEAMPHEDLEALGVAIVEGDHPSSTYYAAELRIDIDEANARARRLGWPILFMEGARW